VWPQLQEEFYLGGYRTVFLRLWSTAIHQLVCGGPQAVCEEKVL
jgi:hypothetical protein